MKKKFWMFGVFALLLVAFFGWRLTHPPLTDEQQIAANIDGLTASANNKSAGGVASYLSKKFIFNGIRKKDFQNQLVGGFLQYRVVKLQTSGLQTKINGDTASSEGRWSLGLKSEYTSPEERTSGTFELQWRRENGEWKIVEADGAGALPAF